MYPTIRYAQTEDFTAIERIFRQHKAAFGRFYPQALREHIQRREVFVAVVDGQVVGFADWHRRRDGWSTVYTIAVDAASQGQGIGRQLLYSVPCPIRLKCTQDNPANKFYAGAGMRLEREETGYKRPLNVWRLDVLFVCVKGGVPAIPELARKAGMAYGIRGDYKAYAWPFMVDVDFEAFEAGRMTWADYMTQVKANTPIQAMAVDYQHPSQRRRLYQQIRDLHTSGIPRVMVCPKFAGAIDHIPSWCIVALSVPSTYAGWLPNDFRVLAGRRVHLLGGRPELQREIAARVNACGGQTISMDGNYHTMKGAFGQYFDGERWIEVAGRSTNDLIAESGAVVTKYVQTTPEQLPMLF